MKTIHIIINIICTLISIQLIFFIGIEKLLNLKSYDTPNINLILIVIVEIMFIMTIAIQTVFIYIDIFNIKKNE
jgi:hypothetical protein